MRFGFFDSLMSRALLRGFITAVGTVVLVQQSILLLGLGDLASEAGLTPDSTTIQRLLFLFSHLQADNMTSVFSAIVLFVIIITPQIKKDALPLLAVTSYYARSLKYWWLSSQVLSFVDIFISIKLDWMS